MGDNFYECVSGFDTDVSVEDAVRILDSLSVVDASGDKPKGSAIGRALKSEFKDFRRAIGKSLLGGLGIWGIWESIRKELEADRDWDAKQKKAIDSLLKEADAKSALDNTKTTMIGYGSCKLPEGFYLLGASGVTDASLSSMTFSMPIILALDWEAYKSFTQALSKVSSRLDGDSLSVEEKKSLEDLQSRVVNKPLTDSFKGKDFLKYISVNAVSGDYEIQLTYVPSHDMDHGFLLNVSGSSDKSGSKFTLSVLNPFKNDVKLARMPKEQR